MTSNKTAYHLGTWVFSCKRNSGPPPPYIKKCTTFFLSFIMDKKDKFTKINYMPSRGAGYRSLRRLAAAQGTLFKIA